MKALKIFILLSSLLMLQACIHKIVTVPAKIAYKTTKGVVKGGVAVGKAIIPGGDDKDNDKDNDKNEDKNEDK